MGRVTKLDATTYDATQLKADIERKLVLKPMACGRCDACGKILEDTEVSIRGYASGEELGLCRRCASNVNTEAAINYAESLGHEVKAKVVPPPRPKKAKVGEPHHADT